MGPREGYIYALCDPDTNAVRYVGQTVKKPRERYYAHLWQANVGNSPLPVHRWIASLGCPPVLRLLETGVRELDLDVAERRWIAKYRDEGADLWNVVKEAPANFKFHGPHTEEARAKIGAAHKGKYVSAETRAKMSVLMKGRKHSDAHRAKISAALKGKPKSEAHRKAIGTGHIGLKASPETIAKLKARRPTPETIAKISATKRGKPWSEKRRAATTKRREK